MKHILGMMTSEEKHLMASHSAMEYLEHYTFIKDHERNSVIEWSLNDSFHAESETTTAVCRSIPLLRGNIVIF